MQIGTGAAASRRAIAGIGRVLLWSGGSIWIGRDAGRVETHAHHAIQVALSLDAGFLMSEGRGEWREHRGAIVMPHRSHRFDGCGSRMAMLFVEPETAQGRALCERYGSADITDLAHDTAQALVRPLSAAYAANAPNETLVALGQQAVAALVGQIPAAGSVDPRISHAIAWMRARLESPVSLNEAAAIAHLSPSRFRHLFVAQTGVSFRAYLLWARVERAVATAMEGQSWTVAAQDAGFADSAHLSRTCRRMFGIAPATLVRE
ncbi:MAG TPA: AraC family transcriptional regulator [Albitalea sp.]|uniref:AraC family transcriptional regulator n=1 Tax=Piscinibacter sp. TaxID=1903157 RepID=UPI002ED4FE45